MAGLWRVSRRETERPARSSASGQLSGAPSQKDIHPEGGRLQATTQNSDAPCIMHLVQFGLRDGTAIRGELATDSGSVGSRAAVMVMKYGRAGFLFWAVMRARSIHV